MINSRLYQSKVDIAADVGQDAKMLDEGFVRYNILMNGVYLFDSDKNSLTVFDCNMTRYIFSVEIDQNEVRLGYLQQARWDHLNASIYLNMARNKFIGLFEDTDNEKTEIVKWKPVRKRKLNLWLLLQFSQQKENKDLFKFIDFYKACSLLK